MPDYNYYQRYRGGGMPGAWGYQNAPRRDPYNWMTDPNSPWNQLLSNENLEKWRETAMQDWQQKYGQMQKQAWGDIEKGVQQKWGGTGATTMGIESSIPGQWAEKGMQRWQQNVGNPQMESAMRNIEQEYLQGSEANRRAAMDMLFQAQQFKAMQDQQGGSGWDIFGNLLGLVPGIGGMLGNLWGNMGGKGNRRDMYFGQRGYGR